MTILKKRNNILGLGILLIVGFLFVGQFSIVQAEPTTDGLVAHWKLDEETSGGADSVLDSSGNSYHGTPLGSAGINNTPQPSVDTPEVSFANERSRSFDGTDDYIATPYSPVFVPGDSFTWSLWFKTSVSQSGKGIFSARDSGKTNNPLAEIYLASGQVQGLFRGASGTRKDLLYTVNYADGQWHNISIVIDDGEGRMYFNGVERATFSGLDMNIDLGDVFIPIGASNYENNVQRYFEGLIDDVRVYNRALSPGEISELAGLFPINEDFDGLQSDKWVLRSNATWGAMVDGESTLRLTTANTSQSGLGYYDTAFSSSQGIVAEFDYYSNEGTGADGIVFFLVDGDLVNVDNIEPGAFGSSLGYAKSGATPGVPFAYLGIGFDEFGGFPRSGNGKTGLDNSVPDNVTLRGGGNGTDGYDYLIHTDVSAAPINQTIDGGWRKVRISVSPDNVSATIRVEMSWDNGGTWYTVIDDYTYNETPPEFFKLGFTAGTGGSTNIHAIDNLSVSLPADLVVDVIDEPVGTYEKGDPVEYTYTITNNGPNSAGAVTVANTLPIGTAGFENILWSYTSTGGASGSGDEANISSFAVPVDVGDVVTVFIQGVIGNNVDTEAGLDHTVSATPGFGVIDPSPGNASQVISVATGDMTKPSIVNLYPAPGATGISPGENLVITFDEPVTIGHGHLVFYKASDDAYVFTVDLTSSAVQGAGTDTLTITPFTTLLPLTEFYVHIPDTGFRDASNNYFDGIDDSTTWRFTTGSAPDTNRISTSPVNVSIVENGGTQDITFTLDEPIITPLDVPSGLTIYTVSSNIDLMTSSASTIYWTNDDWDQPRTITVTGVDNDNIGDAYEYLHWSVFTYSEYYKGLAGSVPVTILDDDQPDEPLPVSQRRNASGGIVHGCKDPQALNYTQFAQHDASRCQYETPKTSSIPSPVMQTLDDNMLGATVTPIVENTRLCNDLGVRTRLLRRGVRGEDVRNIQECLNIHGATLDLDGILGPVTENAVRVFQAARNILVDGIIGAQTWQAMQQ
jgi:uncharacterized repeat protein (TIGR01451 family)